MISPRGASFKYLVRYLEFGRDGKQRGRAAWMEFHNLSTRSPKLAACFMAATAAGSVSGTKKPVYHFCVSFDIDDVVDEAVMRQVAERTRRDMGLLEYQCVVVAHQDRSHLHLHFVVNRVHPERRTLWRDWRDYYRLERSLRAQEVEFGLRVVPGRNAPVPSLDPGRDGLEIQSQNERWLKPRLGPRRGDDAFLHHVTVRAAPVLQRARSWAEIERGLAEEGLTLRSKGGGFIITDGKHLVKASEVGRACSRYHLEKGLGRWPDYRARMALASMTRTEPVVQPEPVARQLERPTLAADPLESVAQQDTPTPAATPIHKRGQQARARGNRRPQFGDAGQSIIDLFGHPPAKQDPAASVLDIASIEPVPQIATPAEPAFPSAPVEPHVPIARTRLRRRLHFLNGVKDRAAPVLQRAGSWDDVERGLTEHGLSLRVSGGGFTITDGEMEVKASEVGRAFSRFHLEKRLGPYSGPPVRTGGKDAPGLSTPPLSSPVQHDVLAEPDVTAVLPDAARAPVAPPVADMAQPLGTLQPLRAAPAPIPGGTTTLGVSGVTPSPLPDRLDVSAEDIITLPQPTVEPMRAVPPSALAAPMRDPAVLVSKQLRSATRREQYREVIAHFTRELKALYGRPHEARRAFAEEACMNGREQAVRLLTERPEHYGRLSFFAKRDRLSHAVQRGGLYAEWQEERTRPATRRAAALYRQAIKTTAADRALRDAERTVDKKAVEIASINKRSERAVAAERLVQEGAPDVYAKPQDAIKAINAYRKTNDLDEVVRAIREAPERFGALRARKRSKLLKPLFTPNTSAARTRAHTFAFEVRAAYEAVAARPKPGNLERAQEARREAIATLDSARRALSQLRSTPLEDYAQQAADVVRRAARGSMARVERLADQLARMLPAEAATLARNTLGFTRAAVQEQDVGRGGRPRNTFDF